MYVCVRRASERASEDDRSSYLTAGLASLFVSKFACCYRDCGCRGRCCLLVRVDRHWSVGVQELGYGGGGVYAVISNTRSIYGIIVVVEFVVVSESYLGAAATYS